MFMNKRTFYSIIYRFKKIMPTVLICIEIELKFMYCGFLPSLTLYFLYKLGFILQNQEN